MEFAIAHGDRQIFDARDASLHQAGFIIFPSSRCRALLTARKLIQGKLHDIEMSIRGILRGFGLKVGPTTRRTYAGRIRELIAGHSIYAS